MCVHEVNIRDVCDTEEELNGDDEFADTKEQLKSSFAEVMFLDEMARDRI